MTIRFASSVTTAARADRAVDEILRPIDSRVTPGMVDLALLFVTPHFEDDLPEIVDRVLSTLPSAVLLGCTAEGTIGFDQEVERTPSLSLLAASLPEVSVRPFHIRQNQLESARTEFDWEPLVGVSPESGATFISLADPFRVDVAEFIEQINQFFPGSPVVGGIASGGHAPGENRLIVAGELVEEGIVGVTLSGRLDVSTVVSQGCRPIGRPFVITKGERNVIQQLGGRPALEQLHDVIVQLPKEDDELARQALFLGRVIDERKAAFGRGDFLIQNILGADRASGALGIAGHAKVGATVQFHVRDAASADEDLRAMLATEKEREVAGAMLFSCNGRGTNMWPKAGHDVGVLRELLGPVPVAGFFCGGEFGPVGQRNFIHGFTASIALFRERNA
ncbi:MAG: FIST C-terminal domain-containing protein [Phycisphaerae bacterium]|nr:FIST C-terminal domain-containing protein [Phycisphaerae bacterium]